MKMEFNIRLLNKIMDLRYSGQPRLKKIKTKYLRRQIKYREIPNQNLRDEDNLSLDQLVKKRWARQISHGLINQKKIKNARVVVFGVGGIGSNVLTGLIYSGVHNFKIIDHDIVTISNLNRQTLYVPKDVGSLKIEQAEERLLCINPEISIKSYNIEIDYPRHLNILNLKTNEYPNEISNLNKIIKWGDFIVNALDHQGAPYLINDLCVKNHKPFYWAGVNHSIGEIYSFSPVKKTACLRCIFGPSDLINREPFLRYRKKDDGLKGSNMGSTVISTGIFISEMILHDIIGIENFFSGHSFIYDALEFKIKKIPIHINRNCLCRKYL